MTTNGERNPLGTREDMITKWLQPDYRIKSGLHGEIQQIDWLHEEYARFRRKGRSVSIVEDSRDGYVALVFPDAWLRLAEKTECVLFA